MRVKIKKLTNTAVMPTRGSKYAAGYDLYADLKTKDEIATVEIRPHETVKVGTGLAVEIPKGFFGGIYARSGIATKQGLRPANCVGIVDSDYRGEIIVALHNDTNEAQYIHNGERIAQIIASPYLPIDFEEVEELSNTDRGSGGFGSTGA